MNEAIDDDNDAFFNGDGNSIIKNCFYGVLKQNKDKANYMSAAFRVLVEDVLGLLFRWPDNEYFGNYFKYLWQQYATNVRTNLRTHCEKRLKQFFKMRAYELNHMILSEQLIHLLFDDRDVVNAVNYSFKRKNTTQGDADRLQKLRSLLEKLHHVGAPLTREHDFNIKEFTLNHWFQSLRMWLNIQRDIDRFHLAFSELNAQWYRFHKNPLTAAEPGYPQPPEIKNFAAVPMCSFQRRHIQIDTDSLHDILSGTKLVPRKISDSSKKPPKRQEFNWKNIIPSEFRKGLFKGWGLYFDMDKIFEYVKNKK